MPLKSYTDRALAAVKRLGDKTDPRILDCRKRDGRMSSLSFTPKNGGLEATVAAHEGTKPVVGDYLALAEGDRTALYRVTYADHCYNVDPANMWIARAVFVPGKDAAKLGLPGLEVLGD